MSTSRFDHAFVSASNGKLYAIGGCSDNSIGTIEEYDPTNDTWTTKTSLLSPRCGLEAVATANGKIYVVGGIFNNVALNIVEQYDVTTDTWTTKSPMNLARWTFGLSLNSQGKIYAIGGADIPFVTHYTDSVEEYDPIADSWTQKTAFPVAIREIGIALAGDGKVYIIGGQT